MGTANGQLDARPASLGNAFARLLSPFSCRDKKGSPPGGIPHPMLLESQYHMEQNMKDCFFDRLRSTPFGVLLFSAIMGFEEDDRAKRGNKVSVGFCFL